MIYKLFIDDERDPVFEQDTWIVVRSIESAKSQVSVCGPPEIMSIDYDLSHGISVMNFLVWLKENYSSFIPDYIVHSSNPSGRKEIIAFMENWWEVANGFKTC